MATEITDFGGLKDRHQQISTGLWWKDKRFEWDANGNCIYLGYHRLHDPELTDQEWVISKLTYDVNNNCTRVETLKGSWDGRTSMSWGV